MSDSTFILLAVAVALAPVWWKVAVAGRAISAKDANGSASFGVAFHNAVVMTFIVSAIVLIVVVGLDLARQGYSLGSSQD